MKRMIVILLTLALLTVTAGCGASGDKASAGGQASGVPVPAEPDEVQTKETETGEQENEDKDMDGIAMEQFIMENGKTVFLYVPQKVKEQPEKKVPMVLFMCGTTCDPVDNVVESGWLQKAEEENFIVISPDYNNYATYSETDFLISVVEYMIENYPVDTERIYSTGFSNGGAASVALARDYPEYFAAISAMGWMVDLDNKNNVFESYDMPFQVVQGSGEFTEKTQSGVAVMDDEKKAVRSLFLYNEMIDPDLQADYGKTPYWGYAPDETETATWNGREWRFDNYYKEGYQVPFAQLVIVEDREHRPRQEEAEVAWNFFQNYKRNQDGKIIVCGDHSVSETMRTVQDGEYTGFGANFAWANIERYVGKTIRDVRDECLVFASPIHYITGDMPPVLLQHGDADTICPIDQSRRFYRAAVAAAGEDRAALTILPGAEHGDSAFETAENMETVKAFLDKYLMEEQ